MIKQKFGEPDSQYPIRETYQMQENHSYLIDKWNIGKKSIEVSVADARTHYHVDVDIFLPEITKKIRENQKRKKDSISKNTSAF